MSGRREGVSVDTAQGNADYQRRRDPNGQRLYAPLPLTRDRLNCHSTVAQSNSSFIPGQHKPNISKSQFTESAWSRRQPFTDAFVLPTERERLELLVKARRLRSADSRYAATVGLRGDITSTLALHPMQEYFPRPVSAKNAWPTSYTEERLQAYKVLAEGAAQPELPLAHQGASVDFEGPATAESDAFMDDLFDFDRAVEGIKAAGRVKEAEAGAASGPGVGAAGENMMEEM